METSLAPLINVMQASRWIWLKGGAGRLLEVEVGGSEDFDAFDTDRVDDEAAIWDVRQALVAYFI